ncbi:MAG: ribonuclease D [Pelagibacteraceae bacterium]
MNFKIIEHLNDLNPDTSLKNAQSIGVDCEMSGLAPTFDKLHLVQICDGTNEVHLIRIKDTKAPNLKQILENNNINKIFHYGRSDLGFLKNHLKINVKNIFDTKIASKICRKFTSNHGLKDLAKDLIGIKLDKEQQTSDWGKDIYTKEQILYAASDVLYLHKIKSELEKILIRENKLDLAIKSFEFLETRTDLDLAGLGDIFEH